MVVVYKFIARVVSVTVISEVCSERSCVVWVSLRAGVETCLSARFLGPWNYKLGVWIEEHIHIQCT